jgi:hypothetical protein
MARSSHRVVVRRSQWHNKLGVELLLESRTLAGSFLVGWGPDLLSPGASATLDSDDNRTPAEVRRTVVANAGKHDSSAQASRHDCDQTRHGAGLDFGRSARHDRPSGRAQVPGPHRLSELDRTMLTDRLIDDVLDDEFTRSRRGSGRPRPVNATIQAMDHTGDEPVAKVRKPHKDSTDRDRMGDRVRHDQAAGRFSPRPIIASAHPRQAGAVLSAAAATCVSTTDPAGGSSGGSSTGTNQAPDITNPGDQTNNEGDSVSLELSASDPDCDSLTFSASGLPTGLSIDSATGLISGTLGYSSAGTYSVTVSVSDGALSDSEAFGP